jgi:hypothetical protein
VATLARRVIAQTSAPSATGVPTRTLGRTGERVSIVCLGGWHIRSIKDDAESIRVMHAAIDEGINFFDNAWIIGTAPPRRSWARRSPWMPAAPRSSS